MQRVSFKNPLPNELENCLDEIGTSWHQLQDIYSNWDWWTAQPVRDVATKTKQPLMFYATVQCSDEATTKWPHEAKYCIYPRCKTAWWLNTEGDTQQITDSCGARVINGQSLVHSFPLYIHFMHSVKRTYKNTDNEIPATHLPFPFPWHSTHWRCGHSWHAACVSHTVAPPSWPAHATGCQG